jgi:prenyltransferase beta subunit
MMNTPCRFGCAMTLALAVASATAPRTHAVQTAPPPEPAAPAPARSTPATGPATAPAPAPASQAPPPVDREGTERIDSSAQNNPTEDEMTPELEAAIARGLENLKSLQNADGSFGRGRYGRHAGITGLCALAFMGDGHLPGRGKYGDVVAKALDFVLKNATETGLLAAESTHGPMYGHGFAALFLGEIYGMTADDDRTRDALVRAMQLIVNSQNDEGGWRYNPVPYDADVSVTICQIMALRSARNAGIKVPKETIDAAVRYVRECQNPDGGFRYMKDMGGSAWPRTAAGIASLFYAGIYKDDAIERGLDYLVKNAMPTGNGGPLGQAHYFYGHYYAVQAMYLAGGERWQLWWPAIRGELLNRQDANGGWNDHQAGEAYGTAMALIILQMPKRYLPIFQK